jgi:hypothetical protein
MTTAELKGYLSERDVEYSDDLDRESLCRQVWEAHCDCMSLTELVAILSENQISTAGCRDIASRRQRARESFQAQRPATQTPTTVPTPAVVVPGVREHDVATLTGLNRAEMNGIKVIVVQPDGGGGRAEVRLESGKMFRVKWENLAVERLEDYLD